MACGCLVPGFCTRSPRGHRGSLSGGLQAQPQPPRWELWGELGSRLEGDAAVAPSGSASKTGLAPAWGSPVSSLPESLGHLATQGPW